MFDRRTLVLSLAVAAAFLAPRIAVAAEKSPFTPQAFAAAQQAGRPILVEITASWCPTCKAQKPILGELTGEQRFRGLAVFELDFDTQKSVVRSFGATMQSTLIAFKGGREVGRSVGDTRRPSIENLLAQTI